MRIIKFVNKEQAIKLKKLGFNEPCISVFRGGSPYFDKMICGYEMDIDYSDFSTNSGLNNFDVNKDGTHYWVTRPTYEQVFEWFRNNFKLHKEIFLKDRENELSWKFEISVLGKYNLLHISGVFLTYEDAELFCLNKLIEIAENEKKDIK